MHDNDMILYRKNHYEMFLSNHIKRYLLTDVAKRDPTLENYPNEKKKKKQKASPNWSRNPAPNPERGIGSWRGFRV